MYLLVAKQLIIMALIAVISFFFSKKHHYGENESRYLSNLLLFVISPCLILNTFTIPFTVEKLTAIGISMIVSFITLTLMSILTMLFIHSKTEIGKSRDCLDKMALIYSNAGFIGIPLINGVFGSEGVFLLMGYIVVFNLFLWIQGIYFVTGRISPKRIITNPNIIAVIGGIILFLLPLQLPSVLTQTTKMIGDLNSAIAMIILGMLFANFKKPVKGEKAPSLRITKVMLLRLLVLPLVVLLVFKVLHLYVFPSEAHRMILMIIFIVAACPVAMNVANFAVLYDKDESYGSLLVAISSVLCVVTLPVLVKIADSLL